MADAAVQIFGGIDPAASAVLASLGGRYRVMAELGRGGFGQVLLAEDELLRRKVAIKILRKTRRDGQKNGFTADAAFLTEARMVARMEHAGIVPIYDVIATEEGGYCIISRYVEGRTLREHLGERRLPFLEATDVAAGLCEALSHAHKLGVAHRDVKPANIMLTAEMRPLLLDFGLARSWSELGGEGLAAGTPGYMSPEQARGEDHLINNRSDIFSLGVVFYEMLTGQQAFPCGSARQQVELLESGGPPPPRQIDPCVPKELERICLKALQPQIRMRYAMATDMLDDLCQWHASMRETVVAKPPAVAGAGKAPVAPLSLAQATSPHSAAIRVVPRGLRAFDQGDADFFLTLVPGPRDRHGLPESLRFWKQRIESDDPMVAFRVGVLYGPSGCGKSSLIRAGLLPRCAEHITVLFHEARSTGNATRLARALWQKFPSLAPFGESPPVLLQKLRHNGLLRGGRKLLIVIDQTEQWLRAGESPAMSPEVVDSHGETLPGSSDAEATDHEDGPALLNTLRQCDGTQVQILMLVRDDFWRSVSRLLAEADVELDNNNSALVDLFELRHAEMVLESFGRAYRCLPEDPAVVLSKAGHEFIRESVRSLEEHRRVSPVRLALFAQMFRDREWSLEGLRQVGGVSGVAVTFLEETFRGPSARATHRMHEQATRQVLQLFVPETGDVRGTARTQAELLVASGYEQRPKAFQELLHALDADLRLLTPVDTLETTDGQSSWQLTHDHMVPALRDWLQARKADTLRGRAEIRLGERAREWHARPDPARLPSVWEWLHLRLLTKHVRWTKKEARWMRKGMNRAQTWAAVCVIMLCAGGWILHELRAAMRGDDLAERVLSAPANEVAALMKHAEPWRKAVLPRLAEASTLPLTTTAGLNARLALVDHNTSHVPVLATAMLEADAEAFAAIQQALEKHPPAPETFHAILDNAEAANGRKLRAYVALTAFDESDSTLDGVDESAARWLVTSVSEPTAWAALLGHRAHKLSPLLEKALHAARIETDQKHVAAVLASLHAGTPAELVKLLRLVPASAAPPVVQALKGHPGAGELLAGFKAPQIKITGGSETELLSNDDEAALAAHANVLLAGLCLGREESFWPCLRRQADRTLRTFLFLNAAAAGVPLETLVQRLLVEQDAGVRQAVLLALSAYPTSLLPASMHERTLAWLRDAYAADPDGGVHSSIATLMQRWSLDLELTEWQKKLPRTPLPAAGKGWWVTPSGVDMRVIRLPDDRRCAIGACEVTQAEFSRFEQFISARDEDKDAPAHGVRWEQAANYCDWLSAKENLELAGRLYAVAGSEPDFDTNSFAGYRLPTRAEWKAAATSAPKGSFDFGNARAHTTLFAWGALNSGVHVNAVARLLPNDQGLWDTLGNAGEWGHVLRKVSSSEMGEVYGGSFTTHPEGMGEDEIYMTGRKSGTNRDGLRLARILPPEIPEK
ncbi:MAG: protein kinase [Verrucomicrobiaceae bacterium]|nr:protein kinase [Verrucomicrobiaceae bacterium]